MYSALELPSPHPKEEEVKEEEKKEEVKPVKEEEKKEVKREKIVIKSVEFLGNAPEPQECP